MSNSSGIKKSSLNLNKFNSKSNNELGQPLWTKFAIAGLGGATGMLICSFLFTNIITKIELLYVV